MLRMPNALQWDGARGHYEVHYLTLTDPATGVGAWIRYTMLAPLRDRDEPASSALWFLAMDPRPSPAVIFARKQTFPIDQLSAEAEPFRLRIADATLSDSGIAGTVPDASWDLRWTPSTRAYEHVHPILRRARVANTMLVLPHADLSIDGEITFGTERIDVAGARGAQAHLWGTKHAQAWAWVHCNDFATLDGAPVPGAFVDGVSVIVPRFGRELGPSTPVVGRIGGQDFRSTSPVRVMANASTFALSGWRFEAVHGARKLIGEVEADRDQLAGVTYHDPDGTRAYCYNSETASMRLHIYQRARTAGRWAHHHTLVARGRAHFEYAGRAPVPGVELLIG